MSAQKASASTASGGWAAQPSQLKGPLDLDMLGGMLGPAGRAAVICLVLSGCESPRSQPLLDASQTLSPDADWGARDAGTPGTLVYFGPHPDDEFYAAPLLGHYCVDLGWDCTMVVFTTGEGGGCKLAGGCLPDLKSVRRAEMQNSAAIFGATLEHWDLGDNGRFQAYAGDVDEVLTLWATKAGGAEALLAEVLRVVDETKPDVVYAPDWRHGNYCHPTHRASGALVATALLRLAETQEAPPLQMITSAPSTEGGFAPFVPEDPKLAYFDGTQESASLGGEVWGYYVKVLREHPSQFTLLPGAEEQAAGFRSELKRVYTVTFDDASATDPLYANLCPPEE